MEIYKIVTIIILIFLLYRSITYKKVGSSRKRGDVLPSKTKYPVSSSWKLVDNLPDYFLCGRDKWANKIGNALKQNQQCGNCWSYAACGMISDRIRLYDKNILPFDTIIGDLDYIDPEVAAKQLQCNGKQCAQACQSQYIDDMFTFIRDGPGCLSKGSILRSLEGPLHKIERFYRVGSNNEDALNADPSQIKVNEEQIMKEIFIYGPVTATIRIYTSHDDRNLYNLNEESRIYGDWKEGPPSTDDGYHSICILGWGINEKGTKYWICRNSWGMNYGEGGLFKVIRGKNFAIIESDCFGALPPVQYEEKPTEFTLGEMMA